MKQTVCLYFVTLLVFSCTSLDNDQDQQDSDSNFYALTVGNSWEYK